MSEVLQCPHCALRFSTRSELEQHKALDHPQAVEGETPASAEPDREEPPQEQEERTPAAPEKRGFFSRLFGRS